MNRWQHWVNGHEFKQAPGNSEGQGRLVRWNSSDHRVGHNLATEQQAPQQIFFCSAQTWNGSSRGENPYPPGRSPPSGTFLCVWLLSCSSWFNSLQSYEQYPARLLCPRNSPGKNTGAGCHALLQGIFPTQVSNPDLLLSRWILSH